MGFARRPLGTWPTWDMLGPGALGNLRPAQKAAARRLRPLTCTDKAELRRLRTPACPEGLAGDPASPSPLLGVLQDLLLLVTLPARPKQSQLRAPSAEEEGSGFIWRSHLVVVVTSAPIAFFSWLTKQCWFAARYPSLKLSSTFARH